MVAPVFLKLRGEGRDSRTQDNISATLEPAVRALSATPIMGAPPPGWIIPTLLLDFVNATGQAVAAYHRDALGYFHGKGAVSTAAGQGAGSVIFTIPMGYRPRETLRLAVVGNGFTFQAVRVTPSGDVINEVAIAAGGSIDLNFTFLVEQ